MNIKVFKKQIKSLNLRELRETRRIVGDQMNILGKELVKALPANLRDKFGCHEIISNIVYNGGYSFGVLHGVGLVINTEKEKELKEQAKTEMEPVLKAWKPFGVIMHSISFLQINDGVIIVQLKLKKTS